MFDLVLKMANRRARIPGALHAMLTGLRKVRRRLRIWKLHVETNVPANLTQ